MSKPSNDNKTTVLCSHSSFLYTVTLIRINKPELYMNQVVAKIHVFCKDCEIPIEFKGNPEFNTEYPTTSKDGTLLIAPVYLPQPTLAKAESDLDNEQEENNEEEEDIKKLPEKNTVH